MSALVLASASPWRARLLGDAGVAVTAIAADIDEGRIKRTMERGDAAQCALRLAQAKAEAVSAEQPEALVIGGDQLLVIGDRWLDKPRDRSEAAEHLRLLRGRTHRLVTAVCVVKQGERLWGTVEQPSLAMRQFSDAFLERYLDAMGDTVTRCVGAYQLEGLGAQLFERVEGDCFSIIGLPLLPLLAFLRSAGAIMP